MPRRANKASTTDALDLLLTRLKELDRDVSAELERTTRPAARSIRRAQRNSGSAMGKLAASPTAQLLGGFERQLGRRVRGVLGRLDVPTRGDVETLTARIIDLERTIFEQLRAGKKRLDERRLGRRLANRRRIDG